MTITAGIDVGTGAVKAALFDVNGDAMKWMGKCAERVRRRDPFKLAEDAFQGLIDEVGLARDDVGYIATTGEAETLRFATGHFYSMTTHARGGVYLDPGARSIMDIGALHARAISIDGRGKVLSYQMTSQCASGSGQFLENIARYLGIGQEEIGPLSKQADNPEAVSGICAVLAETDVINMVSRGISVSNILKGIHQSMAGRYLRLLTSARAKGVVLVTGGLAADVGLLAALREAAEEQHADVDIRAHDDSVLAGALGAALWGAFRFRKLSEKGVCLSA